jgi:hypothetical protein
MTRIIRERKRTQEERPRTPMWRPRPFFHVVECVTDRSGRAWIVGRVEIGCTTGQPHELIVTHCPVGCGREIDTTSAPSVTCSDCWPKFIPTAPPWESKASVRVPAVVRDAADRLHKAINSIEAREIRRRNEALLRERFLGGLGGSTLAIPDR